MRNKAQRRFEEALRTVVAGAFIALVAYGVSTALGNEPLARSVATIVVLLTLAASLARLFE